MLSTGIERNSADMSQRHALGCVGSDPHTWNVTYRAFVTLLESAVCISNLSWDGIAGFAQRGNTRVYGPRPRQTPGALRATFGSSRTPERLPAI